jgi:flagellar hook-associated protein 1 FlgK
MVTNNIVQKDVYAENNVSNLVNKSNWEKDGVADTITYTFDKDISVTVTNGEVLDEVVLNYDIDGDGSISGSMTVDNTNVVRALKYKINQDPKLLLYVEAHNGQYSLDKDGNKIEMNPQDKDYFLIVESKEAGIDGKFESQIIVNNNDTVDVNSNQISNIVQKNTNKSNDAQDDIHFEIFNEELNIKGGKVKSMLDNVDTTSSDNKFTKYKNMLDDFAKSLADISHSYINLGDGKYIFGKDNTTLHAKKAETQHIGLFNGATVKTLTFNKSVVSNLSQENLDYLTTIQWNEDTDIDGTGQSNTSFSKYLQKIKVTISADKENIDLMKETQETVIKSLQTNYDKYTKVNKDDEMINLIKFQAAYEANAKLITMVDEMLATILGMRR